MPAPFSALEVANRFVELAVKAGQPLDPMKLQKLLYYAQGYHLALNSGAPLFSESVQAWKYGPVVQSVYQAFRQYGSKAIRSIASGVTVEENKLRFAPVEPVSDNDPEAELIDTVFEEYGKFDGVQLFKMTHVEGTAWDRVKAANNGQLPAFAEIPNALIMEEFSAKLAKAEH